MDRWSIVKSIIPEIPGSWLPTTLEDEQSHSVSQLNLISHAVAKDVQVTNPVPTEEKTHEKWLQTTVI